MNNAKAEKLKGGIAGYVDNLVKFKARGDRLANLDREIKNLNGKISDVQLNIKKEIVSITRLEIIRIMIEKEFRRLIEEKVSAVDPVKFELLTERVSRLENKEEVDIIDIFMKRLVHKVDKAEFRKFKSSIISHAEFDALKKKQYGVEAQIEKMQNEIYNLKKENKGLAEHLVGKDSESSGSDLSEEDVDPIINLAHAENLAKTLVPGVNASSTTSLLNYHPQNILGITNKKLKMVPSSSNKELNLIRSNPKTRNLLEENNSGNASLKSEVSFSRTNDVDVDTISLRSKIGKVKGQKRLLKYIDLSNKKIISMYHDLVGELHSVHENLSQRISESKQNTIQEFKDYSPEINKVNMEIHNIKERVTAKDKEVKTDNKEIYAKVDKVKKEVDQRIVDFHEKILEIDSFTKRIVKLESAHSEFGSFKLSVNNLKSAYTKLASKFHKISSVLESCSKDINTVKKQTKKENNHIRSLSEGIKDQIEEYKIDMMGKFEQCRHETMGLNRELHRKLKDRRNRYLSPTVQRNVDIQFPSLKLSLKRRLKS
ncbi:unnamed protein product [Moneuplotes crassus]|uniref:Uncharacterized protein n=1 Tax=Euplotes crassus TaxID=5936 RepID=A0AAD1U9U1_EUPCR|nr:unnamed protein product [Moneuplotes crassus]